MTNLDRFNVFLSRCRRYYTVAERLVELGLLSGYVNVAHYLHTSEKIIIHCETATLPDAMKAICKEWPEHEKHDVHMWSPYEDQVVIEHRFTVADDVTLALWLETTVSDIPASYQTGRCEFKKEVTEHYTLVCKREGEA